MDDAPLIYGNVCQIVLENKNLTFSDKTVYAMLTTYARDKDYCYPSIRKLAGQLGCSKSTVQTAISNLEKEGIISSEKAPGIQSHYRLLIHSKSNLTVPKIGTPTVPKNSTGVPDFDTGVPISDPGVPEIGTKEKKRRITKKNNKEENKSIVILPFGSEEFKEKWDTWIRYRSKIKKKYKDPEIEQAALKELADLSNHNEAYAIRIIDKSIANQWQGLFALKPWEMKEEQKSSMQQRFLKTLTPEAKNEAWELWQRSQKPGSLL